MMRCLAAAPVKVATGAALVAAPAAVDRVKLGSELHVAPCATLTVVIDTCGRTGTAEEGFVVTAEVTGLMTFALGKEDFAVEEDQAEGLATKEEIEKVRAGEAVDAKDVGRIVLELAGRE
jgi:hypothetical protein